eukprot:m.482058 g.482058  ORF g.482058 m.482058 type:complete len:77 (-) comp22418_c0_seq1:173-403(-)
MFNAVSRLVQRRFPKVAVYKKVVNEPSAFEIIAHNAPSSPVIWSATATNTTPRAAELLRHVEDFWEHNPPVETATA